MGMPAEQLIFKGQETAKMSPLLVRMVLWLYVSRDKQNFVVYPSDQFWEVLVRMGFAEHSAEPWPGLPIDEMIPYEITDMDMAYVEKVLSIGSPKIRYEFT